MGAGPLTIEAPTEFDGGVPSVFLAGGITGCSNWQAEMVELLSALPGAILNLRRDVWPEDRGEVQNQIQWERRHLDMATLRLFWFPPETTCPITLFELGQTIGAKRPFVIGVHPDYPRRVNVLVQTSLAVPDVSVTDSPGVLADQATRWFDDRYAG